MAAKAREQADTAPLPSPKLEDLPFVAARLALPHDGKPNDRDRTTSLVRKWAALAEEIKVARGELWQYCEPTGNGSIKIVEDDAFQAEKAVLDGLKNDRSSAERAIRDIVAAGGQYLHELENTSYAHSGVEVFNRRRLEVGYRNLAIRNQDMTPDQIIEIQEYKDLKKELDAETAASNKVLEEVRAKIAVYESVLSSVSC